MPFTLAHPAAVLPISRSVARLPAIGLVVGSMAPDLEYLFRLRPAGSFFHTPLGLLAFSLPLALALALLAEHVVAPAVRAHLGISAKPPVRVSLLLICAIATGLLTHVLWDSFTHRYGLLVSAFPALSGSTVLGPPVFKILQHGSSLLGLSVVVGWLWAATRPLPRSARAALARISAAIGAISVAVGLLNAARATTLVNRAGYFAVGALLGAVVVSTLAGLWLGWRRAP